MYIHVIVCSSNPEPDESTEGHAWYAARKRAEADGYIANGPIEYVGIKADPPVDMGDAYVHEYRIGTNRRAVVLT